MLQISPSYYAIIDIILNELIFENFYFFSTNYFLLFAIFLFYLIWKIAKSKKKLVENNKNFQIKVHSKLDQYLEMYNYNVNNAMKIAKD